MMLSPCDAFKDLCSICLGILAELSLVEWTWNGATVAATNWLLKEES